MSRLRAIARHGALDGLSALDLIARRREALLRPRVHFLYLHSVPPGQEARLRRLIDTLSTTHTFISYSEAVRRVSDSEADRPYVALSFDDGFKSNVETSAILDERAISACFFVPTAFIGTPTKDEARAFFGYSQGIDEPAMTWTDLESLIARGHDVGNHTVSHRQVSALSRDQMMAEIGEAAEVLRARLGAADHFAWPFGRFRHFTADAARFVFDTGHRSCASAERGAHVAAAVGTPQDLCVRREHLMTSWPIRHSLHFVTHSARCAKGADNGRWPDGWGVS